MTTYNRATLKTFFETNDVPTGTDYANLIDSCLNIVETGVQSIAGPINPTEVIAPRVSAANGNFTVFLSAVDAKISNGLTVGDIAAQNISTGTIAVGGDVSVSAGSVYSSAMRTTGGIFCSVSIVSAAGTTQGAAAQIIAPITRAKGVTDGSATGFALPANRTGLTQMIINDVASANLWPPTGGVINGLAANAAFGMAANTPYIIYHITASSYAVK